MRIKTFLLIGPIAALLFGIVGCQTTPPSAQCTKAISTGIIRPIVIAHRGASAYLPEHTLAAYQLALEQGADFIETDLVMTKDGQLIARHENELSDTTNVAEHPEFAARKTIKNIDDLTITGWFSEDFTLAEIKTLRARERIPEIRPASSLFNNQLEIPALPEIIALLQSYEQQTGRKIGLYVETKHPTYFQYQGRYLDGKLINQSLGKKLVVTLKLEKFTDPQRIFIQSFEVANLLELKNEIMPTAAVNLPLIQLYDDLSANTDGFGIPHDIRYHGDHGADMTAIYGALAVDIKSIANFGYGDLASIDALEKIKRYAAGIGPWKSNIFPTTAVDPKNPRSARKQTGAVHPLMSRAKKAGLEVHPYTFRAETPFLPLASDGSTLTIDNEIRQYLKLGITGFFIDQPDVGRQLVNKFCE